MDDTTITLYRAWFGDLYREIVLINLLEDVNHFESNERVLFTCNSTCLIKNHLYRYAKNLNFNVKCMDDIKGLTRNRGAIFVQFICDKTINTENINHRLNELYDRFWQHINNKHYNKAWNVIKIVLCLFQTKFIVLDGECRMFKYDNDTTTLKDRLLTCTYSIIGLCFAYNIVFSLIFNLTDEPHVNKVRDEIIKEPIHELKLLVSFSDNFIRYDYPFPVILTAISNCYTNCEKEKVVLNGYCMGDKLALRDRCTGFTERWYDSLNYNKDMTFDDINTINKEIEIIPDYIKQHIEIFRKIKRYSNTFENHENIQKIKQEYKFQVYTHYIQSKLYEMYVTLKHYTMYLFCRI